LNSALANNLSSVQSIFSNSTSGVATQLNTYLLNTIGGNGPLLTSESSFASQVTSLQQNITQLESKISIDETAMQNEFVQMEDAIDSANTDKEYLTAYFSSAGAASTAPDAQSISTNGSGSSSSSSGI
jgi:flagellar capping protein FliD